MAGQGISGTEEFATGCKISKPELRQWKWPKLRPYNGFTHEERVRGWQLVHLLIDSGTMAKPSTCSISGSTENIQMHSEDYYAPGNWFAISQPLHLILHRRFRQPDPWNRIKDKYVLTGLEWFSTLAMQPIDLAATLRAQHGADITDVFRRALHPSGDTSPTQRGYLGA